MNPPVIIKKKRNLLDIQKELLLRGELITPDTNNTTSEIKFGQAMVDAGLKLYPEYRVGDYRFDFKVKHYPILIEIDGSVHWSKDKHEIDMRKMRYATMHGFKILRFGNYDKIGLVISEVKRSITYCGKSPKEVRIYKMSLFEQIKEWFHK